MALVYSTPDSAPIFHTKNSMRVKTSPAIATFVTSVALAILGVLALSGVLNVSTGGGIAMAVLGTAVTLAMLSCCCVGYYLEHKMQEREEVERGRRANLIERNGAERTLVEESLAIAAAWGSLNSDASGDPRMSPCVNNS